MAVLVVMVDAIATLATLAEGPTVLHVLLALVPGMAGASAARPVPIQQAQPTGTAATIDLLLPIWIASHMYCSACRSCSPGKYQPYTSKSFCYTCPSGMFSFEIHFLYFFLY
jgi:hypothetical protein